MSSQLRISFAYDMPPASIEVMSPDMQVVTRLMLFGGSSRVVEVPSENSYLRVHMPSGKIAVLEDPGSLDREVSLANIKKVSRGSDAAKPSTSKSKPPTRGGGGGTLPSDFESIFDLEPGDEKDDRVGSGGEVSVPAPTDYEEEEANDDGDREFESMLELNDYQLSRYQLESEAPRDHDVISLDGFASLQLLRADGQAVLGQSVGSGREGHWQVRGFPERAPLELVLQEEAGITLKMKVPANVDHLWSRVDRLSWTDQLACSIRLTTRPAADTIMSYLQRGDLHAAQAMIEWADRAEQMLASKRRDPYAATVGAYLLLQFRDFDRLHNWARNLANWFDFLPDGCVIWATQLMRQSPDRVQEIQEYLFKAADRGLPVYTEGLRLLLDGLRTLGPAGRDVLRDVQAKAGIVLWEAPVTTVVHPSVNTQQPASTATYDIAFGAAG